MIFEGIDGAGKSTLMAALGGGHHLEKPPPRVTPLQWADHFRSAYDLHPVLSRCHVSEQVYGTLIRGQSLIDDWQAWLLNLQILGTHTVFYLDSLHIEDRIRARDDASDYDLWVIGNLAAMRTAYLRFFKVPVVKIFTDRPVKELVKIVHAHNRTFPIRRGIGAMNPRVVVVGDELTLRRRGKGKPFDFGAAAKVVHAALGHRLDVYLINSYWHDLGEIQSQFTLDEELSRTQCTVVALGENASRRLTKIDCGHRVIAHPQYWRRFRYADLPTYVSELRSACE